MNRRLKRFAIPGLRWTVVVVVLLQSIHFMLSHSQGQEFSKAGLPQWVRPVLGGSEAIAALLFLVPAARMMSGYVLLAVFAIAVAIHFLLSEFNVGTLFVYAMAVLVCMTHGNKEGSVASHD
jgi:DoxX-like family